MTVVWVPAFAGMTVVWVPAFAGMTVVWVPAFAGMTACRFRWYDGFGHGRRSGHIVSRFQTRPGHEDEYGYHVHPRRV